MDTRSHLEWPFFSDAHRRLAEDVDAWARQHLSHGGDGVGNEAAATRAIALQLGASGWLRYLLPRQHGGHTDRIDVRSVCLIREVLASYLGIADCAFAMQGLGSAPITLFGTEELKRRYLPGIAAGTQLAAFCLSEEEAGSDVAAMRTEARRDADAYVLNGKKDLDIERGHRGSLRGVCPDRRGARREGIVGVRRGC